MAEKSPPVIPAAIPLLLFASAIALAPALPHENFVVSALVVCAFLAATIRRFRAGITLLTLALGFAIGIAHVRAGADAAALASDLPPQRFSIVEVEPLRSWERSRGEYRLRSDSFVLIRSDGTRRQIDERLSITASERPGPLDDTALLRAEGFLSRHEGRWYLRVKSADLIERMGEIHPADPRLWNRGISEALDAVTDESNEEPLALARALVLGQSDRLPDHIRDSYIDGGTYHLLVFSGLQIGLAAGFVGWLLRDLRRPLVSDAVLIAMAMLAPLFAGNEPSVARASLMIGVWAGARAIGRPTLRANLLLVACGFRLATHPEEIDDPGFALTFAATAGLAIIGPALTRWLGVRSNLLRAAFAGFAAEMAVLPITINFFGRYVIGGWLVTMLISPLVVLLLALSAAACAAAIFEPDVLPAICAMISTADAVCRRANRLVDDDLQLSGVALPPPLPLLLLAYALSLLLLCLRSNAARAAIIVVLSVPTAVAIITTLQRRLPPGDTLTAIDVGQGDALLVSDGAAAVLVDGGGRPRDPRFGHRVLVPQLLELGARRLDAIVMSHPDPDHCSGLVAATLRLEVGEIWLSGRHLREPCAQQLFEAAVRRRVPVVVLETQRRRVAGTIPIRPILPRLRYKKSPLNNGSIVLHAQLAQGSVLLTGDIESDAEFVLVDDGEVPRADILKVPHHGSRTSSGDAILDAVRPRWTIVSCGRDNMYGHPAPDVIERIQSRGARILRTDRDGTVSIRLEQGGDRVARHVTRGAPR